MVRPVNLIEKQRINAIIASFLSKNRRRRSSDNVTETKSNKSEKIPSSTTSLPSSTTTEFPLFTSKDLKEFLSNAFNVSTNVTEQFLPVAQMSPLFNHFMTNREKFFETQNDDVRSKCN